MTEESSPAPGPAAARGAGESPQAGSSVRPPWDGAGRGYVWLDVVGTAVFVAVVAVTVPLRDERAAQVTVAVVSLALFAVGTLLALWAYATALERSRSVEIGVANLYVLTGATAPRRVQGVMTGALVGQVAVALVGAALGLRGLEGDDLNALAFGVLVPMLGIGTNGAWAARYGSYGPRVQAARPTDGRRGS
ncbi:MAG: hypothetical protein ACO3C1_13025 [Ilumatobacteraceae bacterium]